VRLGVVVDPENDVLSRNLYGIGLEACFGFTFTSRYLNRYLCHESPHLSFMMHFFESAADDAPTSE